MSQTEHWEQQQQTIKRAQSMLIHEPFTAELHEVYNRKLEIIEEILIDLAPERDDPQYTETTSWRYETELNELNRRQEVLEPIIERQVEQFEHDAMLKELGWTQEQFDLHNKKIQEERKFRRKKR